MLWPDRSRRYPGRVGRDWHEQRGNPFCTRSQPGVHVPFPSDEILFQFRRYARPGLPSAPFSFGMYAWPTLTVFFWRR